MSKFQFEPLFWTARHFNAQMGGMEKSGIYFCLSQRGFK